MFGLLGGGLGLLSGGLDLFGGGSQMRAYNDARKDIKGLPGMSGPVGVGGSFGQVGANGQFSMDPTLAMGQLGLANSVPGMLGGGLFNQGNFQQAFGQNDILGALNQANQGFGQQAGSTAFGGLGGLNAMLQGQVAGGPQDFSGGMMGNLMNQGFMNQMNAGNQSALFNQSLNTQRQAAAPEFARQQQALEQSLFNKGMLGTNSTQTGEGFRGLFEAQGAQDLAFQNNAFGQAMQQQNFLAGLGGQQMGQGQQFLGQNLGQFNQNLANLQGIEGQGFNQALQGMQFNASQGQNRLAAAQGLFGLGSDVFNQSFGLGTQGAQGLLGFGNFGLQAARSPFELQASLLEGSGQHASALGGVAQGRGEGQGGFLSGIAGALGGVAKLFSDIRLKSNIKHVGDVEPGIGWYTWEWNDTAKRLGIDEEPEGVIAQEVILVHPKAVSKDSTGYFKVDYEQIGGI